MMRIARGMASPIAIVSGPSRLGLAHAHCNGALVLTTTSTAHCSTLAGGIASLAKTTTVATVNSSRSPQSLNDGMRKQNQAGKRISGHQSDIFSLYRSFLREIRKFEDVGTKRNLTEYVRGEFKKGKTIERKLVTKIEWHVQHGRRKLEDMQQMKPNAKFSIRS